MAVDGQNGVEVFEGLGGPFQDLIYRAETVARSDVPVLILGQTEAGKELLAKRIHWVSARKRGPFVAINPSCITESLVESELFGHEKGAFTGADREFGEGSIFYG
jgi:transcriptional regulator with PAS, ATPase and Fis domain